MRGSITRAQHHFHFTFIPFFQKTDRSYLNPTFYAILIFSIFYLSTRLPMNKIILFYKYIDVAYPKQVMKWQQQICQELQLKGRILISHEGINGTLGGSAESLDQYKSLMSDHELFGSIDFKESTGG